MILIHTADERKQYLHLSVHRCERCKGPVITAWSAVREREIESETQIRAIGAICVSCGKRQEHATDAGTINQFPPIEWEQKSP